MKRAGISTPSGTLIGALVLAVFCGASVWIWIPRAATAPEGVAAAPALDLAARLQMMDETLAGYIAVTSERPLFHATRRPEPAAAPALAPPPPPEPTLSLVGILSDGDARLALVRTSTSPALYRLEAGARLDRWQILEISATGIRVRKEDGAEQVLRIGQ